jgi:hypothetical protein
MKNIVINSDVARLFAVFSLIALSGWGPLLVTETIAGPAVVRSGFAELSYDVASGVLGLTFPDGSRYKYHQVPLDVVKDLRRVANPAEYFARSIRGQYPSQRITETLLSSTATLASRN